MLVHMIQEIVDRHARDLPQHTRDNLTQEILMRIDENFVVLPYEDSMALMVRVNQTIDPKHW